MRTTIVDRRVQKTKKALTEALIQLILEKGYEYVTIQDIIDRANVGRSTFYIHYENKEQLLLDGHHNLQVKLFENSDDSSEPDFVYLFNHLSENRLLAKAMLGKKGGNMMSEFFKNNIAHKIKQGYYLNFGRTQTEALQLEFLANAAATAVISLLVSWLEESNGFSTEEMAGLCKKIVTSIVLNGDSKMKIG